MSGRIILVTGGARSGKSSFAERLMRKRSPEGCLYVATAEALDEEMKERIHLHQAERNAAAYRWDTAEWPLNLPEQLAACTAPSVMVDCLTVWLSNELLAAENEPDSTARVERRIQQLAEAAANYNGTLVMVTNEVGNGVVPAYKLGRVFRDAAGRLNQRMAGMAEEVYLVTAGIPIELKSRMVEL
ncbi:bifunctional adenosylcobinamide kinase/adenosylcobinamide-phosphate guanylyltransferase [Paenibacillus marinisediminis]